jgi:hypothetical protein
MYELNTQDMFKNLQQSPFQVNSFSCGNQTIYLENLFLYTHPHNKRKVIKVQLFSKLILFTRIHGSTLDFKINLKVPTDSNTGGGSYTISVIYEFILRSTEMRMQLHYKWQYTKA